MSNPAWEYPSNIDPLAYDGIVYLMISPSGRRYIGCKLIWGIRAGKRKQSDWKTYYGSNEELLDEIAQGDRSQYRRQIVCFVKHRKDLLYAEAKVQMELDVLRARLPDGRRAYYNSNVARVFFAPRGAFNDLKRTYKLRPLKCICSKDVPFAKRHTNHCSAKCLKQFGTESSNEKSQPKSKRTSGAKAESASKPKRAKRNTGEVPRGSSRSNPTPTI